MCAALPINDDFAIAATAIHAAPEQLQKAQLIFKHTGGLHAAGLFSAEGELLLWREDVGRHNALDKVLGAALGQGQLPLRAAFVLLSGRISFELVQKALVAGVPLLAAVGAPSSLAVQLADTYGMTLLGFVRHRRFNMYTGSQRLAGVTGEPLNTFNMSDTTKKTFKHRKQLSCRKPKKIAAGIPAVASSMKHVYGEVGVVDGTRLMTQINQFDGFDCPGCAWPDPDHHRSVVEFCENGAKAVAEEATTARADADFFAQHSVDDLLTWTDYELGKSGRITEPMIVREGKSSLRTNFLGRGLQPDRQTVAATGLSRRSDLLYVGSHQ